MNLIQGRRPYTNMDINELNGMVSEQEKEQTMDELLNELTQVRTDLKKLQEKERGFKSRKMELEARIVSTLKEQGIDRIGNDNCTVSIKEEVVPTVEDWDQVYQHLLDILVDSIHSFHRLFPHLHSLILLTLLRTRIQNDCLFVCFYLPYKFLIFN